MEYNLPLTKEFKALKVWMTIKAFGATRLRKEIASDIDKATYLSELVDSDENLELMAPVPLSIVCFRYNPGGIEESSLNSLNDQLIQEIESDGRVFLTGTKIRGKTALRVCFINPRTDKEDIQLLKKVVLEKGSKLAKKND
jgi:glutamate/tyrosine decarboxylase-like PLP-dependent enzyme